MWIRPFLRHFFTIRFYRIVQVANVNKKTGKTKIVFQFLKVFYPIGQFSRVFNRVSISKTGRNGGKEAVFIRISALLTAPVVHNWSDPPGSERPIRTRF